MSTLRTSTGLWFLKMILNPASFDNSVPFSNKSSINYSIQIATTGEIASPTTLIIHFMGEYRCGTGRNPDARYMIEIISAAIDRGGYSIIPINSH